jgi:crotonobetainyl-CoA:carnitine CoA-transferase CaiB-like acyl-CoA transferase
MTRPLEGIRIVDLSMGWAGPLACRHMADMGADVIKVESCERFDWWRSWEATPEWIADDGAEKSAAFNMVNRNKRSVTLDLEHAEGRRMLLDLVRRSNAVVENFSGGVMRKLELSYDVLRSVREDVILLSMPAFGSTGPWAEFRAYGSTVEQSSGLPHLNGLPEDPPTMQHVAYGDAVGGLTGASALVTALRHQARTGQGQFVDLSQVEALHALGVHGILEHDVMGPPFRRLGNRSLRFAPHGVYPGAAVQTPAGDDADEWIVIQVFDETQWRSLRAVASPALDDFGDLTDRLSRTDELEAALAGWTKQHPVRPLMHRLQQAGVPAAATNSAASLLEDEQLETRGFWQYLERAVVGMQPNPSAPYRVGAEPIAIAAPAPTMGQHNREVLMGMLGLSEAEVTRLTDLGVIGTRPRMPKER